MKLMTRLVPTLLLAGVSAAALVLTGCAPGGHRSTSTARPRVPDRASGGVPASGSPGGVQPSSSVPPSVSPSASPAAVGIDARVARRAWLSGSFRPVSAPALVGDTVLVYGAKDKQLWVFAVAATDGSVRWRQPASGAGLLSGIPLSITVVDRFVVFFGPTSLGDGFAELLSVDVLTGRVVGDTAEYRWIDSPDPCPGRPSSICLTGDDSATGKPYEFRFDPSTGRLSRLRPAPSDYEVGDELYDPDTRGTLEKVSRRVTGKTIWSTPVISLFGPGATVGNGWRFETYRKAGVYVGTVHGPFSPHDRDLAGASTTAGFSRASGRLLWRAPGTGLFCNDTVTPAQSGAGELVPIRCRYRGRADVAGAGVVFHGLDVVIERFDPATGHAVWSHDLGPVGSLVWQGAPARTDTEIVYRTGGRTRSIDLRTGAVRAVAGGSFWCPDRSAYTESRATVDGHPDQRLGEAVRVCDASAGPATRLPRTVPGGLGVTAGRLRVVATAQGLLALVVSGRAE